ncbi:MAG: hypothetical protein JXX28_12845 [Deltaproteobacteria bacterium]|nr:hypothetical protein [Deltaproteobacteria bacterium]
MRLLLLWVLTACKGMTPLNETDPRQSAAEDQARVSVDEVRVEIYEDGAWIGLSGAIPLGSEGLVWVGGAQSPIALPGGLHTWEPLGTSWLLLPAEGLSSSSEIELLVWGPDGEVQHLLADDEGLWALDD